MNESTELIIAVFAGEDRAAAVLDELKKREDTKSIGWNCRRLLSQLTDARVAYSTS